LKNSVSGEKAGEKDSNEFSLENSGASVPKATNQTGFVDWEPADLEM